MAYFHRVRKAVVFYIQNRTFHSFADNMTELSACKKMHRFVRFGNRAFVLYVFGPARLWRNGSVVRKSIRQGGSMAEWLARPSGNPEVLGSSLAVITL